MNLKIIKQNANPLLPRKEISAEITFEGTTPSNKDVAKSLASHLKVDESVIAMKKIQTEFGSTRAIATANVYNSKEDKEKIENKTRRQRKAEKAPAGAAAPAAAPAEKGE
jgi:ribosomal protein S24E